MDNVVCIRCLYYSHHQSSIGRLCLNRGCENSNRKVCEFCLIEKHHAHEQDCLLIEQLSFILENEIRKLEVLRQKLTDQSDLSEICQVFLRRIKKGVLIIQKQELHKFDHLIKIGMMCYNSLIYQEIIHYIYYQENFKENLTLLNDVYDNEDSNFLVTTFLYKGENLKHARQGQLALEYLNMALDLTFGYENRLSILQKKYDLLLEIQNYGEAQKVLTQLSNLQMKLPTQQQKFIKKTQSILFNILEYLGFLEQFPQFDFFGGLLQRVLKYTSNQTIIKSLVLFSEHDYYAAFQKIHEISKSDPAYEIGIEIQVALLIRTKHIQQAFEIVCQALQEDPENQQFYFLKQILLLLLKNKQEPKIDSNFQPLQYVQCLFKSLTLARCECMELALQEVEKAQLIYPNHILALYIKGLLLFHQEQDIINLFDTLKLTRTGQVGQQILIGCQFFNHQPLSYVCRMIINNPSNNLTLQRNLQNRVLTIISNDQFEQKNVQYLDILGACLFEQGKFHEAYDTLQVLDPYVRKMSLIPSLKAITLLKLNKLDDAEMEISIALDRLKESLFHQDTFYILYIKGCILAQNKKYKEAQSCFEQTNNQCPQFIKINSCIGKYLNNFSNNVNEIKSIQIGYSFSLVLFKTQLKLPILQLQSWQEYFLKKGIALFQTQQYQDAIQEFEKLKCYNNANLYLAISLIQKREFQKAINLLELIEQVQEHSILTLKAYCLIGQKQYQKALEVVTNALNKFSTNWQLHLCKCFSLFCLNLFKEALLEINELQILLGVKTFPAIYLFQALILRYCFQKDEALQTLNFIEKQIVNEINQLEISNIILFLKTQIINQADSFFQLPIIQLDSDPIESQKLLQLKSFFLTSFVQQIDPMELVEEDIHLKKSKIQLWLLLVDIQYFFNDLFQYFEYQQQRTQK